MSVEARDRKIEVWYNKIRFGEIKLPRFQRHEAWDKGRICSLLSTIIQDLPLGITLILDVDKEPFISRYLVTAEIDGPPYPKVSEQLLDGQQRLTAIWRALHNNYEKEKYFVYFKDLDTVWQDDFLEDETEGFGATVVHQSRWIQQKTGKLMPLWADSPRELYKRGCIPTDLLKPEDISSVIDAWIESALIELKPESGSADFEAEFMKYTEEKQLLRDRISKLRETVKHYNLPFLSLPSSTSKDTALSVFINMNTNSKPLTQYDIIVAEIEGLKDTSLHDLQDDLKREHPSVARYFDLSYLILYTSALMQEKIPNQRGIWEMDKRKVVDDWDSMVEGLSKMAAFMESHNIFDEERLPTNAVLAVIAAMFTHAPEKGDRAGQFNVLLKKYMWSAFFTDRYENSAASRAYADYIGMLGYWEGRIKPNSEQVYTLVDAPVFNRTYFPLPETEELLNASWPKSVGIRSRGILAVANYFSAFDFADGSTITAENVRKREYHHIFPDALIDDANEFLEEPLNSTIALNCALITGSTNRNIGRKEPLTYLKERYNWVSETIIEQRLHSHLIPIEELKAGSYEGLSNQDKALKIKSDYEAFLMKRAEYIRRAIARLVEGEDVFATEVLGASQTS